MKLFIYLFMLIYEVDSFIVVYEMFFLMLEIIGNWYELVILDILEILDFGDIDFDIIDYEDDGDDLGIRRLIFLLWWLVDVW